MINVFFGESPYGSMVNTINEFLRCGAMVDIFSNSISGHSGEYGGSKALISKTVLYLSTRVGQKVLLASLIQKIRKDKLDVTNNNLRIRPSVNFDEIGTIYSDHALCIATTTARNTGVLFSPVPVINLRSFEIPMCGGLQITEYNEELASYFEEGKEILFYRNKEELADLIKHYSAEQCETERILMKKAARERAEKEHTWFNRFSKIVDILGIENTDF